MSSLMVAQKALKKLANPARARISQGFFKTGKGQYGEGDVFIGVTMPQIRRLVREFRELSLLDVQHLAKSRIHEERMLGLLILVAQFQSKKDEKTRRRLFKTYLALAKQGAINNWDLVDVTAPHIVGASLVDQSHDLLIKMVSSSSLWERRIAMIATFHFIQRKQSATTLALAKMLLKDEHDLMHKAVGWMLREVGKRCSMKELEEFLEKHATSMPRTMLRYAIEHLPEPRRKAYLKKS